MAPSSNLEHLVMQISNLRSSSTATRYFVPQSRLKELFTLNVISSAVNELNCQPEDRIGLAFAIERNLIVTFSVLIWIRNAESIVNFFRKGYHDEDLPLEEAEARLVVPDHSILFTQEQYQFKPHFFRLGDDREIKPQVILPFVREIERIETGGFGTISKLEIHPLLQNLKPHSDRPVLVVRKTIRDHGGKAGPAKMFRNEKRSLKLLNCLKHPNIVSFLGAFEQGRELSFLFPVIDMDLKSFFEQGVRQGNFRWDFTFISALCGLASALSQVHNIRLQNSTEGIDFSGIGYHHDLRPANVLVNEKTFILADFGIGSLKPSNQSSRTPWKTGAGDYLAPECMNDELDHQDVGRAVDVWAFGCLAAEVVTFMALGKEGLEQFRQSRLSPGLFENWQTTSFHDKQGQLKESVSQWLNFLAPQISCPGIAQPFNALTRRILTPASQRPSILPIVQELSHISMRAHFNMVLQQLTKIVESKQSAGSHADYSMKLWFERERLRAFGNVMNFYDADSDNEFSNIRPMEANSCIPLMIRLFERLQWSQTPIAVSASSQDKSFATEDLNIDPIRTGAPAASESTVEARAILEKDTQNLIQQLWDLLPEPQSRKAESLWVNSMLNTDDIHTLNLLENAFSAERSTEYQGGATMAMMKRIRLQMSNTPSSGLEYEDIKIPRGLITEISTKLRHHIGKYQLDSKISEKAPVIIEWMYHDPYVWEEIPADERLSAMALKAKGFNISPMPKSFRLLHCFGFFEDAKGYGFVYEMPHSNPPCDNFTTLNQLLLQSAQQGIKDPYLNQPLLGDKYLLAHKIAECILEFHTIGWLHENLRSHNVLFFTETQSSSGINPDRSSIIKEPFVVGLHKSRPGGAGWHTEGPEEESAANLQTYQHPDYHVTKHFRLSYDYYALGLMLLEIGLWTPLMVWRKRTELALLNSQEFRSVLVDRYTPRLGPRMGKVYRDVTKLLLTGALDSSDSRVPDPKNESVVFGRFFHQVLEPLARLADNWSSEGS